MNDLVIVIDDNEYKLDKFFIFSGGEVQIRLPENMVINSNSVITVKTRLTSSEKILEVLLVDDALNTAYPNVQKNLEILYFPYARQDRACYKGEAFSLNVMYRLLCNTSFSKIVCADKHSDVGNDNLTKLHNILQKDIIIKNLKVFGNVQALVSPDNGALDKTLALNEHLRLHCLLGSKKRNPNNGVIEGMTVESGKEDFINNKNILIVDDICDGGGTFIGLLEAIKSIYNPSTVTLYVTHGIFSKGVDMLFDAGFDNIITTDSFQDKSLYDNRVKVIELFRYA